MSDINCPYCDAELEVCHDDGQGYSEDYNEMECYNCDNTFIFTTSISYYYKAEKADCLNEGGKHVFELTCTYPREYSKMRCKTCNLEKDLTDDDRKQFGIGTIKEYIDSLRAD